MKQFYYHLFLLLFSFLLALSVAAQQKHLVTIGLNATHFMDWRKGQFLNFFNPEAGYSRQINEHYRISTLLNVFY